jgi:DNA repair exonuclease SbcCD ATPase subunit
MAVNDVVFDPSSGISVEEQKEILSKINGIAERRRRSLSQAGGETKINAKKNSVLFPLLVNITALLILICGAWFIFSFNGKKDVQVRHGTAVYDTTEKALIDEIRKDSAMGDLAKLSNDQERAAAVEAQLAGGLETISDLIREAKYDQAAQSIERFRYINSAGLFPSSRAYQARREFYNKSIDYMETMITHLRVTGGAESLELFNKNRQLEEQITEMQKNNDAISAGRSGQASRIKEMEESISKLEKTSADKDRAIASLETEKNSLTQRVSDLKTVADEKDQEILGLRSQITNIRQLLQE